jgi:hypothetical protein
MTGTDIEIAWAAGIFEGEGSIVHYTYEGRKQRRLTVKMTDEDVVLRLVTATGCGAVTGPEQRREGWKPIWTWNVCRWAEIEYLLQAWRPLLGERRRAKADQLLADPAQTVGRPLLDTCTAGHERTDETVYINSKTGIWHCRVCQRDRAAAKRRAQGKPTRRQRSAA